MALALKNETWDIIFSGLEALALYKESAKDIPFIFVSGTIGEDVAVAAMKAGAHDFNNILGIILGHAALIDSRRRHVPPEALAKGIDGISRTVKRGAGVVRQLLTFARETDINFGAVSLNEIAKEMANLLQETFPANIDIALHLDESVPVVHGDGTQMHQVLLNLCVNARDAMPQGGSPWVCSEAVSSRRIAGGTETGTRVQDLTLLPGMQWRPGSPIGKIFLASQ